MRILHVITKLELGGAQQNTLFTCRRLAEAGHDVMLARGPGGLLEPETESAPFASVVVPDLVREISPARDLRALRDLARACRAFRPDVVHTHSSKAGALGRLAAWRARVPVVVHTVHGWSFSENHPPVARLAHRLVEHAVAPLTDHFLSVSARDLATGVRLGIVRKGNGSVVRSGIDLAEFAPDGPGREQVRQEWGVGPSDVLVVDVSCFKPQKAPLDFVRAAGRAARSEPSLRFALVGDGALRPEIEAAIRAEGLEGRFMLPGWRRDVARVLRAADVVVLTSLWEGLPRTVIQARAVGRPVIATAVNGTPEAVDDGRTGFLLPIHDVDGFAREMIRLARDPALRNRVGSAAREGLADFDQELMVAQQVALYEMLLARDGERRPARLPAG